MTNVFFSCYIIIWAELYFVLSQDVWQTDGWMDRILMVRPHLHSMQRGKNALLTVSLFWDCCRFLSFRLLCYIAKKISPRSFGAPQCPGTFVPARGHLCPRPSLRYATARGFLSKPGFGVFKTQSTSPWSECKSPWLRAIVPIWLGSLGRSLQRKFAMKGSGIQTVCWRINVGDGKLLVLLSHSLLPSRDEKKLSKV